MRHPDDGDLGLTMTEMPNRPDKMRMYALHKSIGLTILALVALRLLWRLYAGTPPVIPTMPRWQHAHRQSFRTRAVRAAVRDADQRLGDEFRRRVPVAVVRAVPHPGDRLARPRPARTAPKPCTKLLFWALVLLALVHAAAALYHHLFQRDATLARMLPRGWLRAPPPIEESRDALIVRPASRCARDCVVRRIVRAFAADYVQAPGSSLQFAGSYQGEAFSGSFPGFKTTCRFDPEQLATSRLDVDDPDRDGDDRQRGVRQRNARRGVLRRPSASRRRATRRRSSARSAATGMPPTARCRCTA